MISMSIFAAALWAMAAPAAGAGLPSSADLEEALNGLEKCRGLTGPECPAAERRYKVHGAKCIAIAPDDVARRVACRVDHTLTYADPRHETTRYRDTCLRFVRRAGSGSRDGWAPVYIRDRPCEMPSALKVDPNRIPERDRLERALVGHYSCYDLDGITDCADQPESASVEAFRCKPIAPGTKGEARVACRVTGAVATSFRVRARLRNACFRLERLTPADQSPAYWVIIHVPGDVRCEVRQHARGSWLSPSSGLLSASDTG